MNSFSSVSRTQRDSEPPEYLLQAYDPHEEPFRSRASGSSSQSRAQAFTDTFQQNSGAEDTGDEDAELDQKERFYKQKRHSTGGGHSHSNYANKADDKRRKRERESRQPGARHRRRIADEDEGDEESRAQARALELDQVDGELDTSDVMTISGRAQANGAILPLGDDGDDGPAFEPFNLVGQVDWSKVHNVIPSYAQVDRLPKGTRKEDFCPACRYAETRETGRLNPGWQALLYMLEECCHNTDLMAFLDQAQEMWNKRHLKRTYERAAWYKKCIWEHMTEHTVQPNVIYNAMYKANVKAIMEIYKGGLMRKRVRLDGTTEVKVDGQAVTALEKLVKIEATLKKSATILRGNNLIAL